MADAGAAYAEIQTRMSALVASLAADQLATRVPACPEWSVQDLVAHHVGVVSGLASGSLTELGDATRLLNQNSDPAVARDRDTMTARQVAERRGRPADAVLTEWAAATDSIMPMLKGARPFPDGVGFMGGAIAVNDVVVHEGDLHEALGLGRPPVVLATSLALAGYGFSLSYRIGQAGLPALAFSYDGKQRRRTGRGRPCGSHDAGPDAGLAAHPRTDPGTRLDRRPSPLPRSDRGIRGGLTVTRAALSRGRTRCPPGPA
jgi:uncharacterized protein (TIGR03083 family)